MEYKIFCNCWGILKKEDREKERIKEREGEEGGQE